MFNHCHTPSEPSVVVTLVIPAKSVPEAWQQLPEALRVHVAAIQRVDPPAPYGFALGAVVNKE